MQRKFKFSLLYPLKFFQKKKNKNEKNSRRTFQKKTPVISSENEMQPSSSAVE